MPHTRRARELGLSRVIIGNKFDEPNDRFKLRLCWAEQCIALCLGPEGMTEIRISLANIILQDSRDGKIDLRMPVNFQRKFFGHTLHHYNALREVYHDPCGGALDHARQATCFVRGGDPVKLATDFVNRVAKFRIEIGVPEPLLMALTLISQPSMLNNRTVNSGIWNTTSSIQRNLAGQVQRKANSVGTPQHRPAVAPTFRNGRIDSKFNTQPWRPEKATNPRGQMTIVEASGEENNPKNIPRTRIIGELSLRAPPPIPENILDIAGHLKLEDAVSPLMELVQSAGGNTVSFECPSYTASGSDTKDPVCKENHRATPSRSTTNGRDPYQYSLSKLLTGPRAPPPALTQGVYASPHSVSGENSSSVSPMSTKSIWTNSSSPTNYDNSSPGFEIPRAVPTPILTYASHGSTPMHFPPPNHSSKVLWDRKPNYPIGRSSKTLLESESNTATPKRETVRQHIEPIIPTREGNKTSAQSAVASNSDWGKLVIRYRASVLAAWSVRTASIYDKFSKICFMASENWKIPLEEVKLTGTFLDQPVQLAHEKDYEGYLEVCRDNNIKMVIVDASREYMGGRMPERPVRPFGIENMKLRPVVAPMGTSESGGSGGIRAKA